MKCPVDGTALVMTDRSGVEIDYCPQCRGVWLDRGELDKIIDRASPPVALQEPARMSERRPESRLESRPEPRREEYRSERDYSDRLREWRDRDRDGDDYDRKKRKKGGILGEIFDF